jgi:hypothetical protein
MVPCDCYSIAWVVLIQILIKSVDHLSCCIRINEKKPIETDKLHHLTGILTNKVIYKKHLYI